LPSTVSDAYRSDLAYIHDAGFGDVARGGAAALLETLKRCGFHDGLVVDLGCGSGILSERVAAAGFDVFGIDISPAFIDLARQRVPAGRFEVGSVLTAEIPPCVAVAAVGEVLSYLFDLKNSDASLTGLFRRIHGSLAPGGSLLFDVATPGRAGESGSYKTWAAGEDWAVLSLGVEDSDHGTLTRHITTFCKAGEMYRRDEEVHRLRLYASEFVSAHLKEIGFDVVTNSRYGDASLPNGVVGFVATKRTSTSGNR
jgi:SAM-dependent methyltransferase